MTSEIDFFKRKWKKDMMTVKVIQPIIYKQDNTYFLITKNKVWKPFKSFGKAMEYVVKHSKEINKIKTKIPKEVLEK